MTCRRVINAGYGRSRVAAPVLRRMAQQRPDTGATRNVLLKPYGIISFSSPLSIFTSGRFADGNFKFVALPVGHAE